MKRILIFMVAIIALASSCSRVPAGSVGIKFYLLGGQKGVDEITGIFLRNMVRDAIVSYSSKQKVDYIYGQGKEELLSNAQKKVQEQCEHLGIKIDKLYWIGSIRLPSAVEASINAKIGATQKAIEAENKEREAIANAKIQVAKAEGEAKSILAKAQAEANRLLSNSLTPTLVEYEKIQKWNGILPQVSGSNALVNLK